MVPKTNTTRTKMQTSTATKLELLNLIKLKKSILFGQFSCDLDNREKKAAWQEILLKAKSLQMVSADRSAEFVRDKLWSVWRSRTMEKRDNKNKTGTGGGKEKVLNEVDHLIIEIIGTDSPVVDGLPIGESGVATPAEIDATSEDVSLPNTTQKCVKRKRSSNGDSNAELKDLRAELIEIKIYKHRLEALKLERELQLPRSKYTETIFEDS